MVEHNQQDAELKKELDKINWLKFLEYGIVRVQMKAGKPTLMTIERTVKLD